MYTVPLKSLDIFFLLTQWGSCPNIQIYTPTICIHLLTNNLQIMKISFNLKPHLEEQRPPLARAPPKSAVQYVKWGVGGWVTPTTYQQLAQGPAAPHQHLPALISSSIDCPQSHTHTHRRKSCVNWGRWKGNCIADGCCVSSTVNSLLTSWACYQFLHGDFMRERMWDYVSLEQLIFTSWSWDWDIYITQGFLPGGLRIKQLVTLNMLPTCYLNWDLITVILIMV